MLFNSSGFLLFMLITFSLYWGINRRSLTFQNLVLLVLSYVFYSFWNWKFLFLLLFSTVLDYVTGLQIESATSRGKRKAWLILSVAVNLGILGFFKYYNFFIGSVADLLGILGLQANYSSLQVILPIGISFYTFHGLSYVFDIYHQRIKPCTNGVHYALFVSFFPLLVAGPIERATHLLPQISVRRKFSHHQAVDGLKQILWGLFKKLVIADGCALYADQVFNHSADHSGSTLALAAILFAFQIYGDFSGYSDIALGVARLLGFELIRNFAFPYFSRDMAEFWRRWHISLSSWFRDYVYIPLGGSKGSLFRQVRNVWIIFILSGLWHGANWTFVVWGALNALYILPSILFKTNRNHLQIVAYHQAFPPVKDAGKMLLTFLLTTIAWVVFRSDSITQSLQIFREIFSWSFFTVPASMPKILFLLIILMLAIEWVGRRSDYALEALFITRHEGLRWSFYAFLVFLVGMYMQSSKTPFIYFQF